MIHTFAKVNGRGRYLKLRSHAIPTAGPLNINSRAKNTRVYEKENPSLLGNGRGFKKNSRDTIAGYTTLYN